MRSRSSAAVAVLASGLALAWAPEAMGQAGRPGSEPSPPAAPIPPAPSAPSPPVRTLDRTLVRFVAAETGGAARPRFLSEREVAFFTRVEALIEQADLPEGVYLERFVRVAVDRLVARTMLAALSVQRGSEPPDLARSAQEARADLEARVGGAAVLDALLDSEGVDGAELAAFLRDQVRATSYIDRAFTPIAAVTEDQLREAHRSTFHPFRGTRLDDVRPQLRRWLVSERMRAAELEFLQGARTRIKILTTSMPTPP